MTSTAKICKPLRQGFTLVEIVIVLVIAAVILGGAITVMAFSSDEYALKKASRELESMAKRARTTAILKQTPYALEFTPGMVRLMPLSEFLNEELLEAEGYELDEEGEEQVSEAVRWELSLDNGMQSQMRRWDSNEWIVMEKDERQLWRFDPDGLCEPIGLELWLEDGRISMEFNPLTAAINEVTYRSE